MFSIFLFSCQPQVEVEEESLLSRNLPGQNNNKNNNGNDENDEEEIIVADYDFEGIDQIVGVTRSAALLQWTHYPGAKEYYIYNMTLGIPVFMDSVEAPANSYQIENLTTPEFTYRYRVRVLTHFGLDSNTKDVDAITDAFIKPDQIVLKFPEKNPSRQLRPGFLVSDITVGDTVNLYLSSEDGGSKCDTKIGEQLATTSQVEIYPNIDLIEGSHLVYASVTFPNNEESECSESYVEYVLDLTPPNAPTGVVIDNPSLSANLPSPKVTVSGVSPGDTIKLYSDDCETHLSSLVASGTSVEFENYIGVNESGHYRFHATTTDSSGNESSCSTNFDDHYFFTGLREVRNVSDSTADLIFDYLDDISSYSIIIKPKSLAQYSVDYTPIIAPIKNLVFYGANNLLSNKDYEIIVRANFSNGYIDDNNQKFSFKTNTEPDPPNATGSQVSTDGQLNISISNVKGGDTVKIYSDSSCTIEIDSRVVPPNSTGESTSKMTIDLGTQQTGSTFYTKAIGENASECTPIQTCPIGYVVVQANPSFGVHKNFCVSRLESRQQEDQMPFISMERYNLSSVKGDVETVGQIYPETNVNFIDALSRCRNSGPKYDLISNAEWTLIANQIMLQDENWTGGSVGDGCLKVGNTLRTSVPDGCLDMSIDLGEVATISNYDANGEPIVHSSRVFSLENGETIFDFAGNAKEFVNFYPNNSLMLEYQRGYTPIQHYYKPFHSDDIFPSHRIINFDDSNLVIRWGEEVKIFFGPILNVVDSLAPLEMGNTLMDEGYGGYLAIPLSEDDSFLFQSFRGGGYPSMMEPPSDLAGIFNMEFGDVDYRADNIGYRCVYHPDYPDCPEGYTYVPPTDYTGENAGNFCVMQFEAKNESGVPVSKPTDEPWTNLTITQARNACQSLGDDFDLINNEQWATVAHTIETNPGSWFFPDSSPFQSRGCFTAGWKSVTSLNNNFTTCDDGGLYADSETRLGLMFGDDNRIGIEFHTLGGETATIWNFAGNANEFVLHRFDENSIFTTPKENQLFSIEDGADANTAGLLKQFWEFEYPDNDQTHWFGINHHFSYNKGSYSEQFRLPHDAILIRGGNGLGQGGGMFSFSFMHGLDFSNDFTGFRCTYNGLRSVEESFPVQNLETGRKGICPLGYVYIQKNKKRGIHSDFCVMQREARMYSVWGQEYPYPDGNFDDWLVATSNEARSYCRRNGPGYELINNQEWSTVAENLEKNKDNWSSGIVGSGCLIRGQGDPADENAGCTSTEMKTGLDQIIYDFAGGNPELVDYYPTESMTSAIVINETDKTMLPTIINESIDGYRWYDIESVGNFPRDIRSSNESRYQYDKYSFFGSTVSGISDLGGGYFKHKNLVETVSGQYYLLRGGGLGDENKTGVWSAEFIHESEIADRDIGFRCVYRFK